MVITLLNILNFAPRRASPTIEANRSLSMEAAVRQNGEGVYAKFSHSQAFGQHWRATAGFAVIGGQDSDFLGKYHRNSHLLFGLRYSF